MKPVMITEADIAAAMLAHGAAFRFTDGGSLLVAGLAHVPAEIRQMFFDCDGQALIAHIRAMPKTGGFRPMNTQATFDDLAASLPALAPVPGTCLTCGEPMNLQDRAGDTWWCPGCRVFANSLGAPLPLPTIRRRPSDAQELLNDLQAAGCGIHLDGDELRITKLAKLSTALWARLDSAGPDFVQLARRAAQIWETCDANPWTN